MLKYLWILLFGISAFPTSAFVMDPVYHAASAMGFTVVGEFEFTSREVRPDPRQVSENVRELHELCPQTAASGTPIGPVVSIVILSWSDREFPGTGQDSTNADHEIADRRARRVQKAIRKHIKGNASFIQVNMACGRPHQIRLGRNAQLAGLSYDVKAAMRIAGAAPSSRMELGLFGEYSQRSKAILWVNCSEPKKSRSSPTHPQSQLAGLRGNWRDPRGKLERLESPFELRWAVADGR